METTMLLGFFLFAALDWYAVSSDWKAAEYVAKPATLAFLLLYALLRPEVSWMLIAALTFSLLGDVYLMLPNDMFIAGLSAFLVGHVAYVFAFDAPLGARLGWLVAVAVLSSPLAFKILGAAKPAAMRPPVAIYMLAISTMVASAFAASNSLAIAGSLLFFGSDATIAWNRFIRPFPQARLVIMVTYHLGQLGLVWGLT